MFDILTARRIARRDIALRSPVARKVSCTVQHFRKLIVEWNRGEGERRDLHRQKTIVANQKHIAIQKYQTDSENGHQLNKGGRMNTTMKAYITRSQETIAVIEASNSER